MEGITLNNADNYFVFPIASRLINIFVSDINQKNTVAIEIPLPEIQCKFMPIKDVDTENFIFVPILHTEK